jgi:DNA-binding transcriptional LysR family regulator
MNISLKQLEVFVTIVECGNFTEAGRKLYLAQSTVSSHITALEETLRVSLFRRESKRTIELTADGKRVYNPTAIPVYIRANRVDYVLQPGTVTEIG